VRQLAWYAGKPKGTAGTGTRSHVSGVAATGFAHRQNPVCMAGNDIAVRPMGSTGGSTG